MVERVRDLMDGRRLQDRHRRREPAQDPIGQDPAWIVKILNAESYTMPATIEDPASLGEIARDLEPARLITERG